MKKRFLSLTLLFLFVLGMAMPVSAHEEIGKEIDLQAFAKVNEIINLGDYSDFMPSRGPAVSERVQELSLGPDYDLSLSVTQVAVCPIIAYVDDNGALQPGRLLSVKRYATFPANGNTFVGLSLTSAQLQSVENEIVNWIASSDIADRPCYLVGWYVGTEVAYTANRPRYIDYWSTATGTAAGTKERRTINKTSGTERFFRDILIPDGRYDSYYNVGIAGNFYFIRTSNGQEGGFAFSGNLTVNSDKNPHQ